jgi:hypothetical protein
VFLNHERRREKRKLKVSEIVKPLEAEILCEGNLNDSEIIGGYCSDLLSDVLPMPVRGASG